MKFTAEQGETLARLTAFQRAVLLECAKIPGGQTRTYLQIAKAVGKPGAARAVGNALGRNPFAFGREQLSPRFGARKNPLAPLIPCHRVVRSDGKAGGYSAGGGSGRKRRLILEEAKKSPGLPPAPKATAFPRQ